MARFQPALLGGLFIGVLSALPVIGIANCCCLWVILGGMLTVYLQQQATPAPVETSSAALSGLIAGALGGLAGVLITPLTLATYDMGLILGLKGFVGAVVVGLASYPWTVLACVAFGIVEALGAGLISSNYRDAIAFGVLIAVLLWRALAALRVGILTSEEAAQE